MVIRTARRQATTAEEPAARIKWTPDECAKIANRWAALRAGDLWGSANALLQTAIAETLPEHRRRHLAGPAVWPHELKTRVTDHIRAMRAKLQGEAVAVSQESPPPAPEIVTVEVERAPDVEKILARFSPGELIGRGIDRLCGARAAGKILDSLSPAALLAQAQATPPANGHGMHKPEAAPVEARPKTWRLLVCGLLGDQRRHVEEKAAGLHHLTLTFQGSGQSDRMTPGRFDHVAIMRKFTSHALTRNAEHQAGKERVHYIEGGLTELMQKLAAINSIPRH